MVDVIIVGGGPAGLSAGLTLGRFRRSVMIYDSQRPRNAKSPAVHNLFTRDGITPQELLRIGREQLDPYTTVQVQNQEIVDIVPADGHFRVTLQDGTSELAKKILFASGVKDTLPAIDGIDALWGTSVFHCPYCHGWEARDKSIAILANGEVAIHFSKLLHSLSDDIVICTNGAAEIGDTEHALLEQRGIRIIEMPIERLQAHDTTLEGIIFTDGTCLEREAIFVRTVPQQHSALPAKLGCALTEHGYINVDERGKTSVEGIFAAGDLATPMHQVVAAAARGAAAAAFINAELAHENFMGVE